MERTKGNYGIDVATIVPLRGKPMLYRGDYGIDVSEYQGEIDYESLPSRVKFVICKACEYRDDRYFERNWTEIKKADRMRGAYVFARPDEFTTVETVRRFLNVLRRAGRYDNNDILVLDLESGMGNLEQWTYEVLSEIRSITGVVPWLYSRYSFLRSRGCFTERMMEFPLWLARYGVDQPVVPDGFRLAMWQKSETDRVEGIRGAVDSNIVMEDYGVDTEKLDRALDRVWEVKGELEKLGMASLGEKLFGAVVDIKVATGRQS